MKTTTVQSIGTGDTVRHSSSGEDWLVAYVAGGLLCACGWPCTLVPVTECTLTEKATAEKRLQLLQQLASGQGDDPRRSHAQRALAALDSTANATAPAVTLSTPSAAPDKPVAAAVAAIVKAALDWGSERTINDWDEAELAKAIATHAGDWPGCEECNHDCDEPCMPHTVAEVHHAIDSRIAQLVHDGKLHAYIGYTPPSGWKPVAAMPPTRRRPITVNDTLTTSFCDTLDGTRWRRLMAFRDVSAERNRQDEQWGGAAHDDRHGAVEWIDYISKQLHRLSNRAERRDRLVKIAALAIAAIESADRIAANSKGGAV